MDKISHIPVENFQFKQSISIYVFWLINILKCNTCVVGHPLIGTVGERHLVISKKTRYGLSITGESNPHLKPLESVGTNSLRTSPCNIAETKVNIYEGKCWRRSIIYMKIFEPYALIHPQHIRKTKKIIKQRTSVHDRRCIGPLKFGSYLTGSPEK